MPRREEYAYDPVNLDDTGTNPSIPQEKAPKSFGGLRQFIQALQAAASDQESRKGSSWSWGAALLLSFLFNVVLVVALSQTYRKTGTSDASRYAQLPSINRRYEFTSPYGSAGAVKANEKKADEMWEAYAASGVVALNNGDAEVLRLPASQEFPWDKDYSLYLISGLHSLHCLKKMRRSITLAHRGEPQMDGYADLLYCFDMVRQDVLCHADDTPMYTAPVGGELKNGEGQSRICRDWDKLEEWALDNTACFAYINETQGVTNELERYKYCPKDSKFAPAMRNHFGLADDWYEEPNDSVPPY